MAEIDVMQRPALTPEEIKRFSLRQPWRSTLGILRVYGLLFLVIGGALWLGGWWIVPAFFFVAALQHAISILQHEAVHGLLFNSHRLNDFVGTYLLCYPIGFSMEYRAVHFAHHRHLGFNGDPDLHNYQPFPASRTAVIQKILREYSGVGAVMQFFGSGKTTSGGSTRLLGVACTQAIIFGLFFLVGHPWAYLYLWLLPLVTFAKGFAQFRNLAEHFVRNDAAPGTERIRTFQSSLTERFFLAPLNFHYHAEHHWYTNVPYYRLPELRATLRDRHGYAEFTEWSPSYVSVLIRLVRKNV